MDKEFELLTEKELDAPNVRWGRFFLFVHAERNKSAARVTTFTKTTPRLFRVRWILLLSASSLIASLTAIWNLLHTK